MKEKGVNPNSTFTQDHTRELGSTSKLSPERISLIDVSTSPGRISLKDGSKMNKGINPTGPSDQGESRNDIRNEMINLHTNDTHFDPRGSSTDKRGWNVNKEDKLPEKRLVTGAGKDKGKKDNWLLRKFMVLILLGLSIWVFYVVVGRICAKSIQRRGRFGRAAGVGILIGFVVLWLMNMWNYLKITLTGPGFARDYVEKTPPPKIPEQTWQTGRTEPSGTVDSSAPDPSTLAPAINIATELVGHPGQRSSSATLTGPTLAQKRRGWGKEDLTDWRAVRRPVPTVNVGPRWCQYCEIVKPERTHHCRHCGTCVLAFDHHCLWIGQCVGWQNHKFFMNFNFWGLLFNSYTLGVLIAYAAKASGQDGEVITLAIITAIFSMFTFTMLLTHLHLILTGRTTVESFAGRDQMEEENRILQIEYGMFWHNSEKKKVRRRWKEEFGGVSVDQRWKVGTNRERWEMKMGKRWWEWIFPVGRSTGDGTHFEQNPHLGPNGEWLMVQDWPKDLRPVSKTTS
ncbi:hypothetical protein TREMEDRAFT_37516 [Tremella mesenterica DSM 1558]|uniref:uncharacterized protein n=1 Tax=Tremella mesenterica (strain ATCC 24925 / CBS 8224 / DSM 1558 / NBRC 9311 / NRRL Y-6157 / RJB 2259-6 / UBC 559-6) TaxID=578456 RepID=UPI0003F49137|nr:uncharacterized protein TREMEDRAFT_37516 [Tremella mesenterica DSM 1558]EIW71033.1 hypothetical protein TREMEDRAFT_37516 [Tremella mesenterica DSM 1558]